MLLNRLEEIKRIGNLERRTDALESDVKHIKGGMNYLFKQVTSPDEPPRRRIGFGADENDTSRKPYAKLSCHKRSDQNCHCRSFVATLDNDRAIISPLSQTV